MTRPHFFKARLALFGVLAAVVIGFVVFAGREPRFDGRTLSAWMGDLDSGDVEIRALAMEAIQQIGEPAVPALVSKLRPLRPPRRGRFWALLSKLRYFNNRQKNQDNGIEGALQALGKMGAGAAPAVPKAMELLAQDTWLGAGMLGYVGAAAGSQPVASRAAILLIKDWGKRDPDLREAITGALRSLGPLIIPQLVEATASSNDLVRARAAALLGEKSNSFKIVVPPLVRLLKDANFDVRRAAADGLGQLGAIATAAGHAIQPLLDDPKVEVRISAAQALARIGFGEERALAVVMENAQIATNDTRVNAAVALRSFHRQAREVVPFLLREFTNSWARVEQAEQGGMSSEDLNRLKWSEGYFRVNAMDSLRELIPGARELVPVMLPVLLRTLDDDRQWVARPGISALATIGPLARDAVPKLLPWLHGQKTDHGREAIKALSLIAPRDAAVLEGFATALGHEQFLFRAATAEALGEALPDERAGALLVRAASDRSHYVRLAAVRSLARASVPPPAFLAALENARHDRFPSVRAAAVETLKAWEKKASSKNTLETSRR